MVNMEGEVVGVNSRLDGSPFESQGLKIATGSAAVPVTALEPLLAIVSLTKAIKSEPKNAAHCRDRAALYLSNRDFNKAVEDYTELIQLEPNDAEAYCSRGKVFAERGNYEKAIADYTEAIARNPDFVEAYRGRAAAREKTADMDGAISDYRELIRLLPKAEADALEPRLVQIHKDRAKSRARAGDLDKAIADLSAVIEPAAQRRGIARGACPPLRRQRRERSSHCRLHGSDPVGAEQGRLVPPPRCRACGKRRPR